MGKDSALALAQEAPEIYLSARGEDRLLASAQEIAAATGARVVPVVADHGTPRAAPACWQLPEPDILVITCSPPRFLQSYLEPGPEEWMSALSTTPDRPGRTHASHRRRDGSARLWPCRQHRNDCGEAPAREPIAVGGRRERRCAITLQQFPVAWRNATSRSTRSFRGCFARTRCKLGSTRRPQQNGTNREQEVDKWFAQVGIPAAKLGDTRDVGALCALLVQPVRQLPSSGKAS
jgi:3-oxoacyl-[acyl-carrier protein] reductase